MSVRVRDFGNLAWCLRAAVSLALGPLFVLSARADGGVVISRQLIDKYQITVFASPVPLRAGPVDVSVLVQGEGSRTPVLDANVEIAWLPGTAASPEWLPPCCAMDQAGPAQASRNHSKNKYLYSAIVPVKAAGASEFVVRVTRGNQQVSLSVPVECGAARPPLVAYWPLLAMPPFAVGIFVLHQGLLRKRHAGSRAREGDCKAG